MCRETRAKGGRPAPGLSTARKDLDEREAEILEERGHGQLGQRAGVPCSRHSQVRSSDQGKAWRNHGGGDFSRETGTHSLAGKSGVCDHAE